MKLFDETDFIENIDNFLDEFQYRLDKFRNDAISRGLVDKYYDYFDHINVSACKTMDYLENLLLTVDLDIEEANELCHKLCVIYIDMSDFLNF